MQLAATTHPFGFAGGAVVLPRQDADQDGPRSAGAEDAGVSHGVVVGEALDVVQGDAQEVDGVKREVCLWVAHVLLEIGHVQPDDAGER